MTRMEQGWEMDDYDEPDGAVRMPVRAGDQVLLTLMDASDAERLEGRSLSLGSHGYVQFSDENRTTTLLHRWILGLQRGDRRIGDHINGDCLDNRRANLRAVSDSGSRQNLGGWGKSRYRGVYRTPKGRWQAKVKFRGHSYYLGTYDAEEEAALAADAKRRELMPEYAGIRASAARPDTRGGRTMNDRERRHTYAAQVRAWARSQSLTVGDRGRLPTAVVAAFEASKTPRPPGPDLRINETEIPSGRTL